MRPRSLVMSLALTLAVCTTGCTTSRDGATDATSAAVPSASPSPSTPSVAVSIGSDAITLTAPNVTSKHPIDYSIVRQGHDPTGTGNDQLLVAAEVSSSQYQIVVQRTQLNPGTYDVTIYTEGNPQAIASTVFTLD